MKPILPLDWEPQRVDYAAWQEIHSRVHAQLDTATSGGPVPSSRTINTTAPLAGGGTLAADLTLSIAANGITNALLAKMPAKTFKGNNTAGLTNAADLTVTQVLALLGGVGRPYLSFASPAGAQNDVNPGGAWPQIGRLDVTLAAGNASWNGLVAANDGDQVLIANVDAANTLTLNNQNAGSAAANRFRYGGNLALPPGFTVLAVYYGGSTTRWVLR